MTAVWKRVFVAGCLAAPAAFGAAAAGVRPDVGGLEPQATLLFAAWPLIFGGLSLPWCRDGLARLWPGFPDLLDPELERDEKTDFSPYDKGQSFVGRGAAMNLLVGAAQDRQPGLRWRQVNGRTGMGKTRLGLEWLKALRGRGWDVGVLRAGVTEQQLRRMIARRRPLAMLFDDADRIPDLWKKLDALAAREWRRPLRVMLVSAKPLAVPDDLPEDVRSRLLAAMETGEGAAISVARLNRHDVGVWAAAADFRPASRRQRRRRIELTLERLTGAAGGRPYFLRLLAHNPGVVSPWRLLAAAADRRLAAAVKALGPNGGKLLAVVALAGPIPAAAAARILDCDKPPGRGKLLRAFPETAYGDPAWIAPPRAGLLALEIAIRVLAASDLWERDRLIKRAEELNPAATAARLAMLGAERPEAQEMFRREAAAVFADENHPVAAFDEGLYG